MTFLQWSLFGIHLLGCIRRTKTSSVTNTHGWSTFAESSVHILMLWKLKIWRMRITSTVSEHFLSSWRFPNTIKSATGNDRLISSIFLFLLDIGKQYKLTVRPVILTTISSWSKKLRWRRMTSWWKSSNLTRPIPAFMCLAGESSLTLTK